MKNKKIVVVLGAGNMGTAMAQVLAENGHEVRLWNWEGDHLPLQQIARDRENKKYLPGIKLAKNIFPQEKIEIALAKAEFVFFAIPSKVMEHTISFAARSIKENAIIIDLSKGVEPHSLQLMPIIIAKHVRPALKRRIVTVSGPAVAEQLVNGHYTAMNVAGKNKKIVSQVVAVLHSPHLKIVPTTDVIGVEVGGSFKNVYAIAMGMCDGLGYGLNTKAALLIMALGELARLIKAMGGKEQTAYELAGLGDLIGTALCPISRNRTFGELLGRGYRGPAALRKVKQTVEGVSAAHCLLRLAERHKIKVPLARLVADCVTGDGEPRRLFHNFLLKYPQ